MRYGRFLQEGGTIGFVAPAFACNIEPYRSGFDHAQEILKDKGYQMDIGPNAYEGSGVGISNTPQLCAQELNDYYCSGENDILISCGGGEMMCEILDHVDFDRIGQAEPKWFMGYSDNTNFTFLLATICDTASIYGPCAATFGMTPWYDNLKTAFDLLSGKTREVHGYELWEKESLKDEEHPCVPYHLTEKKILTSYPAGQESYHMSGRLLGGCLDCLANLSGTIYDKVEEFNQRYEEDGVIWFLEACDLNVLGIRRALWQLDHTGWFRRTRGFLIGRPYNGEPIMGLDAYDAVTEILKSYQVPIIMDVDLGHVPPAMPLVCGSYADVTVEGNDIRIRMDYR